MSKAFYEKYRDIGLLILRIGIGFMFIQHGYPKMMGGTVGWTDLGSVMRMWGIDFMPAFWGFLAACSEFIGGIFLITGVLFRTSCFMLFCTMTVAVFMHFSKQDGFNVASHAVEAAIVFLSLILIGPGKFVIGLKTEG